MNSGGALGMDDEWERAYKSAGRGDLMNIILPVDTKKGHPKISL